MKTTIIIDCEIRDGDRAGTAVDRAGFVARSLAGWCGRMRRVEAVEAVRVYPASEGATGPPLVEISSLDEPVEDATWR